MTYRSGIIKVQAQEFLRARRIELAVMRRAWGKVVAWLHGGHHATRRWFVALGAELDRSPLNQIMFFLAMASVVFGLLSGWDALVGFLGKHWIPLVASLAVSVALMSTTRAFSRRVRRSEEDDVGRAAAKMLVELIRTNGPVSYQSAVDFLWQRYGTRAKGLLDSLMRNGLLKRGFDDHLRIGADNE